MAKNSKDTSPITFPAKLVKPVYNFLKSQLSSLERRKKDIEKEDPFSDVSRVTDNAASDTEAEEQFGHARTEAIREQLEDKSDQIKKALARIKKGKYGICENCHQMIDTDRLSIKPEATLCVTCEAEKEKSA